MALVLVVEDEFGIAKLLEDVLTDDGYRVAVAANGRDALGKAAAERPALVLTDFMMPVMDGAALIEAMTADPAFRDIPIVMMSSLPEASVAARCAGYAVFIRKPFKIFDVVDLVAELLGRPMG